MKTLTYILLSLVIVFTSDVIIAQKLQPVRLEVPSDINVESFHVEILGKKGLLIFYESSEVTNENERKWFFGLFDTALKQQWLKFIPLEDKLEFIQARESDGKLFMLFRNTTRGRNEEGSYEIVSYNMLSNAFSKVTGTFPVKAEIAGFEVIGNKGCLALNIRQQDTDLLFIDLTTGDINPVNLFGDAESYILKLFADQKSNDFYIGMKMIKDNRYMSDAIIKISPEGILELEYEIEVNEPLKSISNYVFIPVKNDELKVFGTYDIITQRVSSFKEITDKDEAKSAGMFYLQFDQGKQSNLKFYDFLSFDNIYGTLGDRTTAYKKSPDKDGKAKEKKLSAFYYLYDPQVMYLNSQYVFSVEVYKPYYTTETRMDYDYYGRPVPYTYQVFGGYDFYDVIIVGLSETGDLIWNNDCAINDLRTRSLDRVSVVFNDSEFVSIAYVNNGKILLQTIEGPVDIGKIETEIETKLDRDRISDDEFNRIKHWYDDYFLIYGYEQIKNRTLEDQSTRTAFYVNKIAYN